MLSHLFKTSSTYVLTSLVSGLIPFLLLPILTRHLTPDDFGRVALFQVLMTLLTPFIGLSLQGLVMRRFFDAPSRVPSLVFHILVWIFGCSAVLFVVLSVLHFVLPGWTEQVLSLNLSWTLVTILASACLATTQLRLTLWQAASRPLFYGFLQVGQTALNLGLSIWLVVGENMGFEGRLLGQTGAMLVCATFSVWSLWRDSQIRMGFNREELKACMSFGLPLIPHALGGWIVSMADRVLLNQLSSTSVTGVYAAAAQLGQILSTVVISVNNAVQPWMFSKLSSKQEEDKVLLKKAMWTLGALAFLGCAAFAWIAPPVSLWLLGEKFHGVESFLWLFASWKFFEAIGYLGINYLFYYGLTSWISFATVTAGAVQVAALAYWIPLREEQGLAAKGAAEVGSASMFVFMTLLTLLAIKAQKSRGK